MAVRRQLLLILLTLLKIRMRTTLFIACFLFFSSCYKEKVKSVPYFQLDEVSKQWFSEIKIGDTLQFEGSNGSVRTFRMSDTIKSKHEQGDCSWNLGTCVVYYEYDYLVIIFDRIDTVFAPGNMSFSIKMAVPDSIYRYQGVPENTKAKATIIGYLKGYNGYPGSFKFPDLYAAIPFTQYSNSIRTYSEVEILTSLNPTAWLDYRGYLNTINEVWVDKKFGLVFFKDVYGISWRRVN